MLVLQCRSRLAVQRHTSYRRFSSISFLLSFDIPLQSQKHHFGGTRTCTTQRFTSVQRTRAVNNARGSYSAEPARRQGFSDAAVVGGQRDSQDRDTRGGPGRRTPKLRDAGLSQSDAANDKWPASRGSPGSPRQALEPAERPLAFRESREGQEAAPRYGTPRRKRDTRQNDIESSGGTAEPSHRRSAARNLTANAAATEPQPESYSKRVARLRKPLLAAADKLDLSAEERSRIFRELRTPRRQGRRADAADWPGPEPRHPPPSAGPHTARRWTAPLRVFCFGVDDVRLYRALEAAGALGRVVVARKVEEAEAVLACRVKRTGRALVLTEIRNAARNAGKPFLELPAVSAVRVMEAVEAVTGWPVPAHLREKPVQPDSLLAPLAKDARGCGDTLMLLTEGRPLCSYLATRPAGQQPPAAILTALDRTDVYEDRLALQPSNPQEREARRQRPLHRPHMDGSRRARQEMLLEQQRRQAEAAEEVPW